MPLFAVVVFRGNQHDHPSLLVFNLCQGETKFQLSPCFGFKGPLVAAYAVWAPGCERELNIDSLLIYKCFPPKLVEPNKNKSSLEYCTNLNTMVIIPPNPRYIFRGRSGGSMEATYAYHGVARRAPSLQRNSSLSSVSRGASAVPCLSACNSEA